MVLAVLGVFAAACVGIAAILGVATLTTRPAVFLAAGIAAFVIADFAVALGVGLRVRHAIRRRFRWTFFASTSIVLVAAFAVTALRPTPPAATGHALPGQHTVTLSTGSRLSVARVPARGTAHRPPIVVVHGGPGVADLEANAKVFAPLAARGSDVYFYAELGAGRSGRLADPRGYTRQRDVADLEALRRRLGLREMTLIGHSYGGEVASAYAAAHPDRVRALVLISPGSPDPADNSSARATGRLTSRQRLRAYLSVLPPRPMLGYALLQVNPRAAHAYFPDHEADAYNDRAVSLSTPALHCHPARWAPEPVYGTGFYAMQYPQSAATPAERDLRPALSGLRTPTLVLKGSCDYLSWRSGVEYHRLLPRSRLVYLHGVGHNLHQDRPVLVRSMIESLLDGRRLPVTPHSGDARPKDYQGPP